MIKIFGHTAPDTDATASALIWEWYLNEMQDKPAKAYVQGTPNTEAAFVLNRWGYETPEMLDLQNGDKVVIDWASGLMWQQGGSIKEMSFAEAKTWIEHFNQTVHAGFRDWRLPTLEEAMSLMEPKLKKGGLHIDSVFERDQLWIWTCDAIGDTSYAWAVNFRLGGCFCHLFNTYNYVRAVRCR